MALVLRSYQESTVGQILDYAVAHPKGRLLVVMPPRSGKTLTASYAARMMTVDQGFRGLWIVHRIEHLKAAVEHLVDVGIDRKLIGIICPGVESTPDAPFQVAMEASLDRRSKPRADFVVWDEAHHDAAPRRRRIRALFPDAFHLGITGTPEQLSGRGLDKDYDDILVPVQPSELIHDDFLAVPTIYAPEDRYMPKLSRARVFGGDWEVGSLEPLLVGIDLLDNLVDEWSRLSDKLATLVFPVTVRHSKAIVTRFMAKGIRAEHLDGTTPSAARATMLDDLRAGRIAVVSSVGCLSEGTDLPEVKVCVGARPTKSLALHIQQGARCMTPWKGVRPRILDTVGNTYRHGFPWEDREWSLSHGNGGRGADSRRIRRCHACHALSPWGATTCPACGVAFPVVVAPELPPIEVKKLEELRLTDEEIASKRAKLEAFAKARGFHESWPDRVMAVILGKAPNATNAEGAQAS